MKQRWIFRSVLLAAVIAVAGLLWGHRTRAAKSANEISKALRDTSAGPQQLGPDAQVTLRSVIQAGNLTDLRWPDFSDYGQLTRKFYESYGYSLPWVRGMAPTAQARQVIALLLNADQKGLNAEDYDGPRWAGRLAKLKPAAPQPSEEDAVRFDAALTISLMRYISDLHIGKVNPKHFDFGLDVEAKKYDLPEFVKHHVVEAPDVGAVLVQVEPPYPGYRRTMQALNAYMSFAKQYDGSPLPASKKTIAPGDSYPGVPQLTRFLRLVGDLAADANVPADETVYQGPLVDAIRNFQRRHGRAPDGRISAQTLADLNVPLANRIRQMQLTLERWRWLPLSYQKSPVIVNIPEFRLRAYDQDFRTEVTMDVVVGKAYGHDTPIFSDTMEYVVFRPYWSVPYSIVKAEFLRKIEKDPDYLQKKGFEVVDSKQDVVSSGTVSSEVLEQLKTGKLFIRQTPGPKNSLGLVKFIFPNNYNIYFHDTPEQGFFAKSRRDFSHGCIRLEKPADLAAWVLRDNTGWTPERIHEALNGTVTQQVNLVHPIPVLIVYATVIVRDDGNVNFYDDIYGHDAALEKVLEKGYPYPG